MRISVERTNDVGLGALGRVAATIAVAAFFLTALIVAEPAESGADTPLTVAGPSGRLVLDRATLDRLPQQVLLTSTPYTDGRIAFAGPLARDVLTAAGAPLAGDLRLVAANGYAVTIPASDFLEIDVVFATSMDGVRLSLRDKGPIWVMYPLDSHRRFDAPIYQARIIWQVVRIEAQS